MDKLNPTEDLLALLRTRGLTLAGAESCTGGLVAAELTSVAGASAVFRGAVIAYTNDIKTEVLQVRFSALRTLGAVSRTVALDMARGARKKLASDIAFAVTGIAGPGGGSPEKPVGTVCFAVVGPGFEVSDQRLFSGDRDSVRRESVRWIISLILKELSAV